MKKTHAGSGVEEIENYIQTFPEEVQKILIKIRKLIRTTCPEAEESFSYGMPAYKLGGKPLIYFAGYKNHIGLYATPSGHTRFKKELEGFKQGKGSVQFPLNEKIPYQLIKKITIFKKNEILEKKLPKHRSK